MEIFVSEEELSTGVPIQKGYNAFKISDKNLLVKLVDKDNQPVGNTKLAITFESGKKKETVLDENGTAVIHGYPYTEDYKNWRVDFPEKRVIPSLIDLWKYHLGDLEAEEVKEKIGHKVNREYIKNTCAIRMSRAFNYSGIPIKKYKDITLNRWETVRGADAKWYALRIEHLLKHYLLEIIGEPDIVSNNKADFEGKFGVIFFKITVWSDATGHIDLWASDKCSNHCYFDKANERNVRNEKGRVMLWESKGINRDSVTTQGENLSITYKISPISYDKNEI